MYVEFSNQPNCCGVLEVSINMEYNCNFRTFEDCFLDSLLETWNYHGFVPNIIYFVPEGFKKHIEGFKKHIEFCKQLGFTEVYRGQRTEGEGVLVCLMYDASPFRKWWDELYDILENDSEDDEFWAEAA